MTESLTVTGRSGLPVAGVSVVVHDASGAAITETVTDDEGVAAFDVPVGGLFTALWDAYADYPAEESTYKDRHAVTYHGVEEGGSYELAIETRAPEAAPPLAMDFTFNVSSLPSPANYVRVHGGCGVPAADDSFGFDGTVEVAHVGCQGHDTARIILAAMNSAQGSVIGYYVMPETPFAAGTQVSIDLSAANFALPTSSMLHYDIADFSFAGFNVSPIFPGGERFDGGGMSVDSNMTPLTGDLLAIHPAGFEPLYRAFVSEPAPAPEMRLFAELAWRGLPPEPIEAAVRDDLSNPYDVQASFMPDYARPTLTCIAPVPLVADALSMTLRYYTQNETTYTWDHIVPTGVVSDAGLLSIATPALPPSASDFAPSETLELLDVRCGVLARTGSPGTTTIAGPLGEDELLRSQRIDRDFD